MMAPVLAADGAAAEAWAQLTRAETDARNLGDRFLRLEVQLVECEIDPNPASTVSRLQSIQREVEPMGLGLIAKKKLQAA